MHPNNAFRWESRDAMRAFVREIGFGQLFATTPDGPRVAHIPIIWQDDDHIRFHIARGNALTRHLDGLNGLFVVNGPDAYISPDWYGIDNQVPTWNYVAVELEGTLRKLGAHELIAQLDDLSSEQEARLAPKPIWTRDKMQAGYFDKLTTAIVGFDMCITAWRGTLKLGQNKEEIARLAVADTLDNHGHTDIAHWMRHPPEKRKA